MNPSTLPDSSPCPCGSAAAFAACCAPYLRREALPATAEALMRSRYSAYVVRDVAYLLSTWSPSKRPRSLSLKDDHTEWLGLRIVETQAGGASDSQGVVEFIARFRSQGQLGSLHERSRFARQGGSWLYVDGDTGTARSEPAVPAAKSATPGRNDPCSCGSGQKYKRCCGR